MDEINEINDLHQFPAPIENEIVLCEIRGRLHYSRLNESLDNNVYTMVQALKRHKQIHITREQLHTTKTTDEGPKNLFLPVTVPLIKEIVQTYYEQGFIKALKLTRNRNNLILSNVASVLLNLITRANQLRSYIYPNIHDCPETSQLLIINLNRTRQWQFSPIRALSWHPNSLIIAVASLDDCVRIFSADQGNQLIPLLKCKQQKNITTISWRPNSNCCLAVACEKLIIIWDIDLSSVITRPSTNNCIILSRPYHAPIVDIAWCPRGVILASVAALDTRIHMWNPEFVQADILKRPSGTGNYLIRWAPDNSKVFTSTNTLVFRVWECKTWKAERWHIDTGYVQTACWSPCSSVLLFVTSNEPFIYSLSFVSYDKVFQSETNNSPNQAERLYDLAKVEIDGVLIGGDVRDMQWDPRGNHLALLFNTTNCVALFVVSLQPRLHLLPCCLLTGLPHEVPCSIAFQQNFIEGACLTVAWSSGRVQYFPVVYGEANEDTSTRRY